jgi:hypothetical protein
MIFSVHHLSPRDISHGIFLNIAMIRLICTISLCKIEINKEFELVNDNYTTCRFKVHTFMVHMLLYLAFPLPLGDAGLFSMDAPE